MRKAKNLIGKNVIQATRYPRGYSYVWITSDAKVNSAQFDHAFTVFTDAWDEIQRYLKYHPNRTASVKVADLVRKEMNFQHFSINDFRRLYFLAWTHFNNEPQRMPCDPHRYKRIVGMYNYRPHLFSFSYGHVRVEGEWNIPEEYWNDDIIPTRYLALEEQMDYKGNKTYLYHVLCLELSGDTMEGIAECIYEIAKDDSRHHRSSREMKIFLPKKHLIL